MIETGDIKVLLVDDHMMVRQGLVFFLSSQTGIEVVGEAESGTQAIQIAKELRPHVILMDLILPDIDGIEVTRQIKQLHPEIEIIVLTGYINDKKVLAAIQAGASGYLMKDVSPGDLARAIYAASRGEIYLHPEAARRLARGLNPQGYPTLQSNLLTDREMEVLRLIASGLSNKNIADDLGISLKTAKTHVISILQKLGLQSRVQAALYALRNNIVPLEDN